MAGGARCGSESHLVKLEDLPNSLQDIAELIGLAATVKLVETYGGVRIYVPQTIEPDHALAALLGHDNALRLARAYGGHEHFDLPRATLAVKRARDAALTADYLAGISYRQLALKYQLTERGVRKIIARAGITEEDRQAALF